jgi:hypothetical protein
MYYLFLQLHFKFSESQAPTCTRIHTHACVLFSHGSSGHVDFHAFNCVSLENIMNKQGAHIHVCAVEG